MKSLGILGISLSTALVLGGIGTAQYVYANDQKEEKKAEAAVPIEVNNKELEKLVKSAEELVPVESPSKEEFEENVKAAQDSGESFNYIYTPEEDSEGIVSIEAAGVSVADPGTPPEGNIVKGESSTVSEGNPGK